MKKVNVVILMISLFFLLILNSCSNFEAPKFKSTYNQPSLDEISTSTPIQNIGYGTAKISNYVFLNIKTSTRNDLFPSNCDILYDNAFQVVNGTIELETGENELQWKFIYDDAMVGNVENHNNSGTNCSEEQLVTDTYGNILSINNDCQDLNKYQYDPYIILQLVNLNRITENHLKPGDIIFTPIDFKEHFINPILANFPARMRGEFILTKDKYYGTQFVGNYSPNDHIEMLVTKDKGSMTFKQNGSSNWIDVFIEGEGLLDRDTILFLKRKMTIYLLFNYPGIVYFSITYDFDSFSEEVKPSH